jgi:hypothetical protein
MYTFFLFFFLMLNTHVYIFIYSLGEGEELVGWRMLMGRSNADGNLNFGISWLYDDKRF